MAQLGDALSAVAWLRTAEALGGVASAAAIVFAVLSYRHQRRTEYCRRLREAVISIRLSMSTLRETFRKSLYHEYVRQAVYSPAAKIILEKILADLWDKEQSEKEFEDAVDGLIRRNLILVLPFETPLTLLVEKQRERNEAAFAVLYRDVPSLHRVLRMTYQQTLAVQRTCIVTLTESDEIWIESIVNLWKRDRAYVKNLEVLQNELTDSLRGSLISTHNKLMGPDLESCFNLSRIASTNFLEMEDRGMYKFRQPIESLAPLEDFGAGSGVDYQEFQAAMKGLQWLSKDDREAYSQELKQLQERYSRLMADMEQRQVQNNGQGENAAD